MTVKELRDALATCPDDVPVHIYFNDELSDTVHRITGVEYSEPGELYGMNVFDDEAPWTREELLEHADIIIDCPPACVIQIEVSPDDN